MDIPKYDGNIHPDEWINGIEKYLNLRKFYGNECYNYAASFVDSTILLPTGINSFEELRNALKEDISFTVFKNTNKRILKSLKYIPEREGGRTSKFISTFRKLCYNAEINDIEEQKGYFCQSLANDGHHYNYFFAEFLKRNERINSMNDLIKEFEEIATYESDLIRSGSIVALKHVATGKYLGLTEDLRYTTGSNSQAVFVGNPDQNSLWKITFDKELATYNYTSISLQRTKSIKSLGLYYYYNGNYSYYKSPLTEHTEVSCNGLTSFDVHTCQNYQNGSWKFKHSKLENHQGYLKSNDTINLCINKKTNGNNIQDEFLRSHDIRFNIGNNTLQEVVCHNERLGGNDEWCIELIR